MLEKHADFLRDFRGDTIHPSTLEVMYELGLLASFLERPHQKIEQLAAVIGDRSLQIADFTHLSTQCRFIALMPQWDFLDFIATQAKRYSSFQLRMQTEATGLIEEHGRVVGVRARAANGELSIRADLVVAADGRDSNLRDRAGLRVKQLGAPIDVLWMRLSKQPGDPHQVLGRVGAGALLVMLDRGDYWQCAYVIAKGEAQKLRGEGIAAFRDPSRTSRRCNATGWPSFRSWDDVKLLSVAVDRLAAWCATRFAVHRRCGPCDVSGWRRRHQPRHSGCGGCLQSVGGALAQGSAHAAQSRRPSRNGACCRRGSRNGCRCKSRTTFSATCLPAVPRRPRRCRCGGLTAAPICGACRRA